MQTRKPVFFSEIGGEREYPSLSGGEEEKEQFKRLLYYSVGPGTRMRSGMTGAYIDIAKLLYPSRIGSLDQAQAEQQFSDNIDEYNRGFRVHAAALRAAEARGRRDPYADAEGATIRWPVGARRPIITWPHQSAIAPAPVTWPYQPATIAPVPVAVPVRLTPSNSPSPLLSAQQLPTIIWPFQTFIPPPVFPVYAAGHRRIAEHQMPPSLPPAQPTTIMPVHSTDEDGNDTYTFHIDWWPPQAETHHPQQSDEPYVPLPIPRNRRIIRDVPESYPGEHRLVDSQPEAEPREFEDYTEAELAHKFRPETKRHLGPRKLGENKGHAMRHEVRTREGAKKRAHESSRVACLYCELDFRDEEARGRHFDPSSVSFCPTVRACVGGHKSSCGNFVDIVVTTSMGLSRMNTWPTRTYEWKVAYCKVCGVAWTLIDDPEKGVPRETVDGSHQYFGPFLFDRVEMDTIPAKLILKPARFDEVFDMDSGRVPDLCGAGCHSMKPSIVDDPRDLQSYGVYLKCEWCAFGIRYAYGSNEHTLWRRCILRDQQSVMRILRTMPQSVASVPELSIHDLQFLDRVCNVWKPESLCLLPREQLYTSHPYWIPVEFVFSRVMGTIPDVEFRRFFSVVIVALRLIGGYHIHGPVGPVVPIDEAGEMKRLYAGMRDRSREEIAEQVAELKRQWKKRRIYAEREAARRAEINAVDYCLRPLTDLNPTQQDLVRTAYDSGNGMQYLAQFLLNHRQTSRRKFPLLWDRMTSGLVVEAIVSDLLCPIRLVCVLAVVFEWDFIDAKGQVYDRLVAAFDLLQADGMGHLPHGLRSFAVRSWFIQLLPVMCTLIRDHAPCGYCIHGVELHSFMVEHGKRKTGMVTTRSGYGFVAPSYGRTTMPDIYNPLSYRDS